VSQERWGRGKGRRRGIGRDYRREEG